MDYGFSRWEYGFSRWEKGSPGRSRILQVGVGSRVLQEGVGFLQVGEGHPGGTWVLQVGIRFSRKEYRFSRWKYKGSPGGSRFSRWEYGDLLAGVGLSR